MKEPRPRDVPLSVCLSRRLEPHLVFRMRHALASRRWSAPRGTHFSSPNAHQPFGGNGVHDPDPPCSRRPSLKRRDSPPTDAVSGFMSTCAEHGFASGLQSQSFDHPAPRLGESLSRAIPCCFPTVVVPDARMSGLTGAGMEWGAPRVVRHMRISTDAIVAFSRCRLARLSASMGQFSVGPYRQLTRTSWNRVSLQASGEILWVLSILNYPKRCMERKQKCFPSFCNMREAVIRQWMHHLRVSVTSVQPSVTLPQCPRPTNLYRLIHIGM